MLDEMTHFQVAVVLGADLKEETPKEGEMRWDTAPTAVSSLVRDTSGAVGKVS